MKNPFESGHIKNYVLFYASIVVIMILFFIASTLFNDIQEHETKVFNTEINESIKMANEKIEKESEAPKFKLMEHAY